MQVALDGRLGDREPLRHLRVAQPDGDTAGDGFLARREPDGPPRWWILRQLRLHCGRYPDPSVDGRADRSGQRLDREALLHDRVCAQIERGDDVLGALARRQHHDAHDLHQRPNVVEEATFLHLQVEEQNVAGDRAERRQEIARARNLGDDVKSRP